MHFDFSFEQQSLAEGVRRVLQSFPAVNERPPHAYRPQDVIQRLAEFGIFGEGGEPSPLGAADLVAVAIEAGRTIVAAPVAEALAASMTFAGPVASALQAGEPVGVDVAQTGNAAWASHGGEASLFVLRGAEGWLVAGRDEVEVETADGVDITADLAAVRLKSFANAHQTNQARSMDDMLRLACLAEIVGAASAMLDRTVAYVGDRKQFGKPIGSNQAVKHMAADCAVAVETMKAAVEYAGWCLDMATDDAAMAEEARLALASAASFVGEHGRRVAERCIQMHGGIAFTWDYGLHVPLRRILFRTATIALPRQAREDLAAHLLEAGA
jgi:alkylation response protein AidB-like acyl-CoA dehydrogenase